MISEVVYVVGEMEIASYFGVGVEEPALLGPYVVCFSLRPLIMCVFLNLN